MVARYAAKLILTRGLSAAASVTGSDMTGCASSLPGNESSARACSGKCGNSACAGGERSFWLLAACQGKIAIFEKPEQGTLKLVPQNGSAIAPAFDLLTAHLDKARKEGQFSRLVLVGGKSDIAWMRMLVPESISGMVFAEIEYPLMEGWFSDEDDLHHLSDALERVLS